MNKEKNNIPNTARWFWKYGKDRYFYVLGIIICIGLITGSNILRAKVLDQLITVSISKKTEELLAIIITLIAIVILGLLSNTFLSLFKTRFGATTAANIRRDFFSNLLKMPISKMESLSSGSIISLYNNELNKIISLISGKFVDALLQPIMFIGASVYMLMINWKLYLICYILLPLVIFIINKLAKKSASYASQYYEKIGYANELSKECIDGITEIKSFNLENSIAEKCKKAFDDVLFYILQSEKYDALSLPIWLLNLQLSKIMCILFGGFLALNGELTVGELVAYVQLTLYVSQPASSIIRFIDSLRQGSAALKGIRVIMGGEDFTEVQIKPIGESKEEAISFKDVTFAYGENIVLLNCNFSIKRRGFNVLAGASGQGKSTILSLICGLYPLNRGEIRIAQEYIEKGIAYVSQDNILFPGTIAENIAFGIENPSFSSIKEAAIAAGAHEFICQLPKSYDTPVGERGQILSGGQRQRIAIARAFFRKSPLVLMDEPTSAVDTETEEQIVKVLLRLSKESTLLISSHRLSTIREADCIYVLEGGRIVESGTHEELSFNSQGIYHNLYKEQMGTEEGEVAI
ncbi:ABC transporter ATP-binding protein [Clostridium sp. D2Q-11]|uniref:ABC transporter ATP-binding protein n=1 Tax=Anaeromonas frigoriresistens TaxID=2683708 RepID=A0A942Z7R8_9FIRM|nr:ABC transporter ATP-binding protein [Anaeromonas frigoriresistens]MBS4539002.1 ABC transporter ATP-binding protein [Anaeromonas frigoriresistens]